MGAGIGGLTAAFRLQKAGFDVEVFERETSSGGRVRSIRLGDAIIDAGATVILPAYRQALALIHELGMSQDLQPIRGAGVIPRDGRLHLIDMDAPVSALFARAIGWRGKWSLLKLVFPYLSARKSLNFLSLGTASGRGSETLEAFCRSRCPPKVYRYLLNPALKFEQCRARRGRYPSGHEDPVGRWMR